MERGCATHRSPTRTPQGSDKRSARQSLRGRHLDGREAVFWGLRILQQLCGAPGDLELYLELRDSTSGCRELGVFAAGEARLKALIDARLLAPDVDRLVADAEIPRDVDDLATRIDQVKNLATELWRVPP
jgi:hypothetical protein